MRYISYLQVIPNGSSEKSGLKAGDQIEKMDGNKTNDMTLLEAQDIIKNSGTKFTLDIREFVFNYLLLTIKLLII